MVNHSSCFLITTISIFIIITNSQPCHPTDKEALLAFRETITDDPSHLLETWTPNTNCCTQWEGIVCEPSSGRVIILTRRGFPDAPFNTSMSGHLSPFLGNLSSLLILDLSNLTDLSGPIPPELGNLARLTQLYLNNNRLSGPVPDEFKNLVQLSELDLHSNNLSGGLKNVFSKKADLPQVTYYSIDLSHNMFSGPIDDDIGNTVVMGSVRVLVLSHNRLSGPIPRSIGNLSSLETLELEENGLSGGIPKEVLNLESIRNFNVSDNQLSGEIPAHKAGFPASAFAKNAGLCGYPLPVCKHGQ